MRNRILVAVLAGACILAMLGSSALAADPVGNNGTVKVDGLPFDTSPDNEPHVGCAFQIDFYGYDMGDLRARATFRLHSPTGQRILLLVRRAMIGEDAAGGGTDLDATINVNLGDELAAAGIDPHALQGFHVKLTVRAEGSIGADTKYKVYWVESCENPYA